MALPPSRDNMHAYTYRKRPQDPAKTRPNREGEGNRQKLLCRVCNDSVNVHGTAVLTERHSKTNTMRGVGYEYNERTQSIRPCVRVGGYSLLLTARLPLSSRTYVHAALSTKWGTYSYLYVIEVRVPSRTTTFSQIRLIRPNHTPVTPRHATSLVLSSYFTAPLP